MAQKKKLLPPRRKRMNRKGRLASFKHRFASYTGKNIVRAYSRYYAVELLCAVKELKMLGVKIDPEYEKQLRISVRNRQVLREKQKRQRLEKLRGDIEIPPEYGIEGGYDEHYAYIAGFTSGGAPFGVTWEEMEAIEKREAEADPAALSSEDDYDDDIPF